MTRLKPLLFTPLKIRGVELRNRIAVSPMAMYSAENGYPVPFHHVLCGWLLLCKRELIILAFLGQVRSCVDGSCFASAN